MLKCVAILSLFLMGALPVHGGQQSPAAGQSNPPAPQANNAQTERAAVEQELIAKEKQTWTAEKNNDIQYFKNVLADDFLALEPPNRRYGKQDALLLVSAAKISAFKVEDVKVILPSKATGIVISEVALSGNWTGEPLTVRFQASTVWAKRGGKWYMVFHQTTPSQ